MLCIPYNHGQLHSLVSEGKGDVMARAAMGCFYSLEESSLAWLCFGHASKCPRSGNDQAVHDTSVTPACLLFKSCVISMVVYWHRPSQPMALVTLWLSSRLWLLKSPPLHSQERVCVQPDQVPAPLCCVASWMLALVQRGDGY